MDWQTPLLIFCARVCDVSVGTIRIVSVTRGRKFLAAFLGFFEVTIWLLAASAVLSNINESWASVVAYGAGFSTGTLLGMAIEEKLAMGHVLIRVVNADAGPSAAAYLRERGFVATEVEAYGAKGPHELCFSLIPRRDAPRLLDLVRAHCPSAVVTVEDVELRHSSLFPKPASRLPLWRRLVKMK